MGVMGGMGVMKFPVRLDSSGLLALAESRDSFHFWVDAASIDFGGYEGMGAPSRLMHLPKVEQSPFSENRDCSIFHGRNESRLRMALSGL